MKDISETRVRTRPTRSDAVVLGTLLQATRGILLIAFNWTMFIQFDRTRSIPGLDIMVALPPSIYYLIGFMDILMVKWVWRRSLNGWRYGIAMSILILIQTPTTLSVFIFLVPFTARFLFVIIALFSVVEIYVLCTPGALRFYRR